MSDFFDDDWSVFFDPNECGAAAVLICDSEIPVNGRIIPEKNDNKLQRQSTGKAGVKVAPVSVRFQIPTSAVPTDWQNWAVRINKSPYQGQNYSIVDVDPNPDGSSDLTLTPYKPRGQEHGEWLRAEN
jgi:hypothetical protein